MGAAESLQLLLLVTLAKLAARFKFEPYKLLGKLFARGEPWEERFRRVKEKGKMDIRE